MCRRLRTISDAYVVMVSASGDEVDQLLGLEIGADDYITKPFSPRDLRARVGAMLRRPRLIVRPEPAVQGGFRRWSERFWWWSGRRRRGSPCAPRARRGRSGSGGTG